MAGTFYSDLWGRLIAEGSKECCTTGKCKTCPVLCFTNPEKRKSLDHLIAARAYEKLLEFEKSRQKQVGNSPLALYIARLLSKKAYKCYSLTKDNNGKMRTMDNLTMFDQKIKNIKNLSQIQKKRLVNDSHALITDGIDRHRIWEKYIFKNII